MRFLSLSCHHTRTNRSDGGAKMLRLENLEQESFETTISFSNNDAVFETWYIRNSTTINK